MKKRVAVLLALSLLLLSACAFAEDARRYEGPGYATPEEAVEAYLSGMRAADLSAMLSTFAIESYVDHYNFRALLERIRTYGPSQEIRMPSSNDFTRSLNVENRKARLVNTITNQFLRLHLGDSEWLFRTIPFPEDADIDAFLTQLASLEVPVTEDLTMIGFISPEILSDSYRSEGIKKTFQKQAAIYGVDELKSMAAGFTLEGKRYLLCCDVGRYGDAWFMLSLGGIIGNLLNLYHADGGILPFDKIPE